MFRKFFPASSWPWCFPRIRGDVPSSWLRISPIREFSPHTRGCSGGRFGGNHLGGVFPAYAGMFRRYHDQPNICRSFPRIRGDVPRRAQAEYVKALFSPHTRGCSDALARPRMEPEVFPAYAGMFLLVSPQDFRSWGFPRIRGDVPETPRVDAVGAAVFPAYAGMFRKRLGLTR